MITRRLSALAAAAITAAFAVPQAALAHPHVWVAVEATIAYADGNITGLQQRWTFDDMYTAMAIQGLDKNGDGTYDREELTELAKVNIDGIKQFDYFTFAKLNDGELKFAEPKDFWLEYKDAVLTLNFTLPLAQPLAAETPGFAFSIYDPSYFIAFDFAKDKPVKLGEGAPANCALDMDAALSEDDAAQNLANALSNAAGTAAGSSVLSRTVRVKCVRS